MTSHQARRTRLLSRRRANELVVLGTRRESRYGPNLIVDRQRILMTSLTGDNPNISLAKVIPWAFIKRTFNMQ